MHYNMIDGALYRSATNLDNIYIERMTFVDVPIQIIAFYTGNKYCLKDFVDRTTSNGRDNICL